MPYKSTTLHILFTALRDCVYEPPMPKTTNSLVTSSNYNSALEKFLRTRNPLIAKNKGDLMLIREVLLDRKN